MAAYKWCGRQFPVNANIVGQEVEKIEKTYGSVTAELLVDTARAVTSPIHDLFEWNDAIAAEGFRKQQAAKILCALTIENVQGKEVRAYVNVSQGAPDPVRRTGTFINVTDAFSDPNKRAIVLQVALRELNELKQKYKELTELEKIFKAITQVTTSLQNQLNNTIP